MKTILWLLLVFPMVFTVQTYAGDQTSMRGLGMGRAAVASTRGTDAIGVNPANLALTDVGNVQVSLAPTSFYVSTELFNYNIYKQYFTGVDTGSGTYTSKLLNEEDKQIIRDQMSSLPATRLQLESMIAGISFRIPMVGGIGIAIIEHAGATMILARDYFDLLYLEGLQENKQYAFDGTSFEAWWYREYNVSYGRRIPIKASFLQDVEAGVSVKVLQGFGIFQTTQSNGSLRNQTAVTDSTLNTLTTDIHFTTRHAGVNFFDGNSTDSFTPFPTPVGSGMGFDFGFSARLKNGMRVAASVTDLGSIQWKSNIVESYSDRSYSYTGYDNTVKDSITNLFNGTNREGTSFTTALPTVLHVGCMAESKTIPLLRYLPGNMLLSFEYAQGFNNSFGNTEQARFSLGMEYRLIPLLVFRSGAITGGGQPFNWTFGAGLDLRYLAIDVATNSGGLLFSHQQSFALSAGVGLKLRF
jgi:hypothetical protein